MRHPVTWQTAAPLWPLALEDAGATARFRRPALLRFANDAFMEELERLLVRRPEALADHALRAETWRDVRSGWPSPEETAAEGVPALYQAAHGRFYLVAASLVCQLPGLPERKVDRRADERASFVLRRLVAEGGALREQGWFGDRQRGRWLPLDDPGAVAAGEERLPLFSLAFEQDGVKRRLHAGLVPVASGEVYEAGSGAPPPPTGTDDPLADPRLAAFRAGPLAALEQLSDRPAEQNRPAQVALLLAAVDLGRYFEAQLGRPQGPSRGAVAGRLAQPLASARPTWATLLAAVSDPGVRSEVESGEPRAETVQRLLGGDLSAGQIREAASLLLGGNRRSPPTAELTDLLQATLGDPRTVLSRRFVAQVLQPLASFAGPDDEARAALLGALLALGDLLERELAAAWSALLGDAGAQAPPGAAETALLRVLAAQRVGSLSWAALLADARRHLRRIATGEIGRGIAAVDAGLTAGQVSRGARELLAAGFPARLETALTARRPAPREAADGGAADGALYAVRCVYERPRCAPFEPPVVSAPSAPFRMASFLHPDAPIRPLRLRMPEDTSVEGLRRYPRGFTVLLSKKLRQQMERAQAAGLDGLMEGRAGSEPSFDLGMICSFSIPIITICALIVLMLMVQLLNIVFWWLPLFRVSFPLRFGK